MGQYDPFECSFQQSSKVEPIYWRWRPDHQCTNNMFEYHPFDTCKNLCSKSKFSSDSFDFAVADIPMTKNAQYKFELMLNLLGKCQCHSYNLFHSDLAPSTVSSGLFCIQIAQNLNWFGCKI